jgi:hypothetical protein
MAEQILCIFCGKKARIVKRKNDLFAVCKRCNSETELEEYKKKLDEWLKEIQKSK